MLHPRCTERLLSSKPEAPPSSNSALVFWNSGSTTFASSTLATVCASGGSSVATARAERFFLVKGAFAVQALAVALRRFETATLLLLSSSTVATLFMPPNI